ncbi:hypothetical protein FO519_010433, partial [Halicephalobus sp. NKZ332]
MSVPGTGQHQGPPPLFSNPIPPYNAEIFSQSGGNSVIVMSSGTSYTETSQDSHTMVGMTMNTNGIPNAPNIPNMGYMPRSMYMMPRYPMYPPAMYQQMPVVTNMTQANLVYHQTQLPQNQISQEQRGPQQLPLAPRQKKILSVTNPDTGANVLPQSDRKIPPEPVKSESTSSAPASVSETARLDTDELRHEFNQRVAAAAFQQKANINDTPKQEQTP